MKREPKKERMMCDYKQKPTKMDTCMHTYKQRVHNLRYALFPKTVN